MTQEYKLSQSATPCWHYDSGYRSTMQPLNFEQHDFPLKLQLAYNPEVSAYTLSWTTGAGRLAIIGAEVAVCANDSVCSSSQITVTAVLTAATSGIPEGLSKEREIAAEHAHRFLGQQAPNNVTFVFPREKKVLWACEAFLVAASPYSKTLLESPFSEGALSTSFDDAFHPDEALPSVPFDDSDDEGANGSQAHNHSVRAPFKLVKITDTCYRTYAAVLVWLSSRYIRFATLRSTSDATANASDAEANAAAISELPFATDEQGPLAEGPPLPASSSPKSVYRLAHLLGLNALAALALENLKSQLTPDNAAYELYSETASCYPAVRDIVLAYVVESWDQVAASQGWAQMEEKAGQGELPASSAQTAMLLARQLRATR